MVQGEGFLDRIEAERRKTAKAAHGVSKSESINRILRIEKIPTNK